MSKVEYRNEHGQITDNGVKAAAEADPHTLTLPNPCPREGDVSIDRVEIAWRVPRFMQMDYRLQEAAVRAFEENPGMSKVFFFVARTMNEYGAMANPAHVAPGTPMSLDLTAYDAGLMNALIDHFHSVYPDQPAPSPELVLRMGIEAMHRERIDIARADY